MDKLILTVKCKIKEFNNLQKILIEKYNAYWPSSSYDSKKYLNIDNILIYSNKNDDVLIHIYKRKYDKQKYLQYTSNKNWFQFYPTAINYQKIIRKLKIKNILKNE